ncbi:MAG: zinc-ribbon and DUF3426 domain-containing protein [Proteobacteria bacterium]|nr:zinc-ribbon and DUF3426 domain-containing protein [Pseudomonadota bacterium]
MFTVCPKCALSLVVTAADLRVAQGYVRCGRCSSVFNALARLSERQAGAPAAEPEAPAGAAAPAPAGLPLHASDEAMPPAAPADEPVPESALEFNAATTDVNAVFVVPPPDPQWTAATGTFRALVAANQDAAARTSEPEVEVEIDAAFLASMLSDQEERPAAAARSSAPTVPTPAEGAAGPAPPAMPVPPDAARRARILADANAAAEAVAAGRASSLASARELTEQEAIEEAEALGEEADADGAAAPTARVRAWLRPYAWPAATVLAALLLLAQVVNHYRDQLAASARFNHVLTSVYGSLGIRLYPRWDLRAYDVRQLGASGDPGGAGLITVRASIKNGAAQAQPLPLLRVTLQDRYGNRIAARDVAPNAYLPSAMPPSSFLSPGQRIDAQMGFADPGPNAVGFEVDACLPASGGAIACANDSALR